MTTQSDTPGEGLDPKALKPCPFCGSKPEWNTGKKGDGSPWRYLACEDCEAMGPHVADWELSSVADDNDDVLIAAWNRRSPSVASDTAALPSGYEGLVDELKDVVRLLDFEGYVGAAQSVSEAIAALGRVQPVAWRYQFRTGDAWTLTNHKPSDRAIPPATGKIEPLYATPPAPQPALALIEELERALGQVEAEMRAGFGSSFGETREQVRRALASAKRFKGE